MPHVHVVASGDCLANLADRFGFASEEPIVAAPANARLRRHRPNLNQLVAGDRILIPSPRDQSVRRATQTRHRLVVTDVSCRLRLAIEDDSGLQLRGLPYRLLLPQPRSGATDAMGRIDEAIPAHLTEVSLVIDLPDELGGRQTWQLRLGYLEPTTTLQGAADRLTNLGFAAGHPAERTDRALQRAVRSFQTSRGLEPSGELGPATIRALQERHDAA